MDFLNKENNAEISTGRPRRKAAASATELVRKQVNVSLRSKLRRDEEKIVESNILHINLESNELKNVHHKNDLDTSNELIKNIIQPLGEAISINDESTRGQKANTSRCALMELVPLNNHKVSKSSKALKADKHKKQIAGNINQKDMDKAGEQHIEDEKMPPPAQQKCGGRRKKNNPMYDDELKTVDDSKGIDLIQEGIKSILVDGDDMKNDDEVLISNHLEQVTLKLSDLELVNDKSTFKNPITVNRYVKPERTVRKNKKGNDVKVERKNKKPGKKQSKVKVKTYNENTDNQTNLQSVIVNIYGNTPTNQIFEQLPTQNDEELTEMSIDNLTSLCSNVDSNIVMEKSMQQDATFIQDKELQVSAQDMVTDDNPPKISLSIIDESSFNSSDIASVSQVPSEEICDSLSPELLIKDSLLCDTRESEGSSKFPQDNLSRTYIIPKSKSNTTSVVSKANPDMTVIISKVNPNTTVNLGKPHILDKTITVHKPAIIAYQSERTIEEKVKNIPGIACVHNMEGEKRNVDIRATKAVIQNTKQKTTATKIKTIEGKKKIESTNKFTTQASKTLISVKSGAPQKNIEAAAQLKKDRLQLETEKKRKLREEKELKAKQQRAVIEEDKKRNLETQKVKEEKVKQALLGKQEKINKQREEAEKRRLNAKLRHEEIKRARELEQKAHETQTQEEQQTYTEEEKAQEQGMSKVQEQVHIPIYMTHKMPLLPTPDCYDSDDEKRRQVIFPQWYSKENRRISLVCMSFLEGRINNTLFCIKPRTPDLREMFPNVEEKKLRRKSSAIWNKPPRFTMFTPMKDDY